MNSFNKIVVIGAGTMGLGIAAHLANSNRQVILLDLKGKDKPNQISENAIDIIIYYSSNIYLIIFTSRYRGPPFISDFDFPSHPNSPRSKRPPANRAL